MVCLAYEIKRGRRKTMKGNLTNWAIFGRLNENFDPQSYNIDLACAIHVTQIIATDIIISRFDRMTMARA